jgi:alpha-L-fucosidase 2
MLDSYQRARLHAITRDTPAVDFFAGALLGNGGLGVCVTTRPDGVMLHLGHNSVWDIRVAENHQAEIGTFAEIFAKVQAISADLGALEEDAWYKAYTDLMQQNYLASYPRPFPCGTILLGLDRRRAEVLGYHLDIADGRCDIQLIDRITQHHLLLQIFCDQHHDRVWMRTVSLDGHPVVSPFERIRILPDPTTPAEFPHYAVHAHGIGFTQHLPSQTGTSDSSLPADEYWKSFHATRIQSDNTIPPHPDDRAVSVAIALSSQCTTWQPQTSYGTPRPIDPLERALHDHDAFVAVVELVHGLASQLPSHAALVPTSAQYGAASTTSCASWAEYWRKSGFTSADTLLEQTWYRNLYFFNCAVSPKHTCPGLFANWSYRTIGNAWHGDYHMNYNTQQPFWLCFSSNHLEKHEAYVNLVDHIMPISMQWAKDYYGLRGAYYPHSAYPTTMNVMPYPVPTWGWEICETPWTVQSLWWHYTYSMDVEFLRTRAYSPIRAGVQFLVDYMQRPEAQWDGTYHIFPTVSPELYGLTPGLHKNADCIVDLTLTKFIFKAFLEAVTVLDIQAQEQELVTAVRDILAHFPSYPTAQTADGPVFVSVPHEHPEVVYNVPSSTTTIFPGEEHGLHSSPDEYAIAARTLRQQRNEGGNELVFLNLQYARMGMLDMARFKRQIAYCLLPNGTCTDMVLQVHGRYRDDLPFDFMAPMGIWLENFALPAVINECVLQSYTGEIRLFPNWDTTVACEFVQLRAVGGFLVSAGCAAGQVTHVHIHSERGGTAQVWSPWHPDQLLTRTLQAGETWELSADTAEGRV